jgi:hypothetical protein
VGGSGGPRIRRRDQDRFPPWWALTGTANAPQFTGRWQVDLVSPGLPSQPFHAAAALEPIAAEALVVQVGQATAEAAAAALRSAVGGSPVIGVAVVVKMVSIRGEVTELLRSHAWMHAAEGVLYREAMLGAARRCGWVTQAVDVSALVGSEESVAALGLVARRAWRRIEKQATHAAVTLLPKTARRADMP